ncbi:MAG: hypothetical protein KGZ69_10260 [Methylomonas sp.]|nr:hypothetical protein [Methylomonas sp.]
MIALLYFIFFFFIYFPLSFWIIRKSYFFAKRKYQHGWAGGLIAVLIMYNLVFWDWIPVILIHNHLCETEGGFWVFKTPEQWVKEHPEVVGLDWSKQSCCKTEYIRNNYNDTQYRESYGNYLYTEFSLKRNIDFTGTINSLHIRTVDFKTGEVVFEVINFQIASPYKIWLAPYRDDCKNVKQSEYAQELNNLINLVKGERNDK